MSNVNRIFFLFLPPPSPFYSIISLEKKKKKGKTVSQDLHCNIGEGKPLVLRVPFGAAKRLTASTRSRGARETLATFYYFPSLSLNMIGGIMFLRLSFLLLIFPFFCFLFCLSGLRLKHVCSDVHIPSSFCICAIVFGHQFLNHRQSYLPSRPDGVPSAHANGPQICCFSVPANPRVLPFQKSKRKKKEIVGQIIKAGVEHEGP
jgi:hypothetical protein